MNNNEKREVKSRNEVPQGLSLEEFELQSKSKIEYDWTCLRSTMMASVWRPMKTEVADAYWTGCGRWVRSETKNCLGSLDKTIWGLWENKVLCLGYGLWEF